MSEPLWRSRPDAFVMHPATTVRHQAINDFIYLSEGYSNSFLVVTPAGRVVINTGMGFEAPVHKAYFDSIDAGPVKYIVLTQGHVDHVGGVDLFKQPGTLVVAQANNPEHQAYDARLAPFRQRRSSFAFAQAFRSMQGTGAAPPPKQSQPKPDVLFRERFHFELSGTQFELIACNGAETAEANKIANEKTVKARGQADSEILDARKDAAVDKRDAEYALAKEKCEALAGNAKDLCMNDAKMRFGKS